MGQDLRTKAKAFVLLLSLVFSLGTALCGWLLANELLTVLSLQNRGIAAQGEVFDYVRERPSGTGMRGMGPDKLIPLIRFQTTDGRPVTVRMNALKEQFPRGSYPLRYLPENPAIARVESFVTMWLWNTILGSATALMVLVTFIMFSARRRIG